MVTATPAPTTGRRGRAWRRWLLAFTGFLLLNAAWSVAAPYDGTPDEREHIVRAAGVAEGQIAPPPAAAKAGSGAFQTVPGGLVRQHCWQFKPTVSAACARPPSSDRTPTRTGTGAGRYQPVYYTLVGWPLVLWPGWSGVLLARLISAALCAALLAGAFVVITRWSRRRLMVAALLAATTPMAVHMGGAVNPNGPEIAAGIAFFTALIPLLVGASTGNRRALIVLAGVSGLLLAVLRQTGPLWLATGMLALAFPLRHSNLGSLVRDRAARWWAAAISLAVVVSGAWYVEMRTADLGNYTGRLAFTPMEATFLVADHWREYLDQMVGVTSWLDARMPAGAYQVWESVAAALVVAAVVFGRWLDRWRLAVLCLGGVAVPSALQVAMVNKSGFITQGRYMLPMLAGVLLFAAWTLEERGLDPARCRALTRLVLVVVVPIHLLCLTMTMTRWQRGVPKYWTLPDLNPLTGEWHPVLGSATAVAVAVAGLAVISWLAWTASSITPGGESATPIRTTGEAAGALPAADGRAGPAGNHGRPSARVGPAARSVRPGTDGNPPDPAARDRHPAGAPVS